VTEAEWLACDDPVPLMDILSDCAPSERKLRLFACDCCRRFEHRMTDVDRVVVDAIEHCAEGLITHEMIYARAGVPKGTGAPPYGFGYTHGSGSAVDVARVIREAAGTSAWVSATRTRASTVDAVRIAEGATGRAAEWKRQSAALRCIFGNSFRYVSFSREWLTDTVLVLGNGMYASRDFNAMPILADALQEVPSAKREGFAGCDTAEVLDHCRAPGPHCRGCWVVDLVLGKG
jgi:hypothetical protein